MKVGIVSNSDIDGGAARASYRLHQALKKYGTKSKMIVALKKSDDITVLSASKFKQYFHYGMLSIFNGFFLKKKSSKIGYCSLNIFGSFVSKILSSLAKENAIDVVNLHWINKETLSIKDISHIKKPIVMTLHDMWAFSSCEHYTQEGMYDFKMKGSNDFSSLLDKYLISQKLKYWNKNHITIVTPSDWLSQAAKKSLVFKGFDVFTIPNAIDTSVYKPVSKELSRMQLNLPLNKYIIGFGAIGGGEDPRKGFDLLVQSINRLSDDVKKKSVCVVVGQSKPHDALNIDMEVIYLGRLNDDFSLRIFYDALDVMVVPSRQENLPQTATESISCGTPVSAFKVTGLVNAVKHKHTGYLADEFDINDLATGIEWCIENKLAEQCRAYALQHWSEEVIAQQYTALFKDVNEKWQRND